MTSLTYTAFMTCTVFMTCKVFMTCSVFMTCTAFMTYMAIQNLHSHSWPSECPSAQLQPLTPMNLRRWCNFIWGYLKHSWEAVTYQYLLRPTPISILCKANTYQYLLQSQHLLILIARPSSTSTLWYQITPSIVQCAEFSIVQSVVLSIVRADVFSIVQGDAFMEMLHWALFV